MQNLFPDPPVPVDGQAAAIVRQYLASDQYELHYRHWQPAGTPLGYVVALHGIQSHSGWYDFSSERLARAGFDVRFLDRRGSGLNAARRGHAVSHERLINDVVQMLAAVRYERNREAPASPVILSGLSWGGKLAAVIAARFPQLVDALVLLYPGIHTQIGPSWFQQIELNLAEFFGIRDVEAPIPLDDPTWFTSVPKWQEFIRQDQQALHTATVSFFLASRYLDQQAAQCPELLRCPTLLMLAGRDRIVDNAGMRDWFLRLASTRKQLREYADAEHTLEFEPMREEFVQNLIDWLKQTRSLS